MIKELPGSNVFLIGLYSGLTKPSSVNEYLNEFVQDMKDAAQKGLDCNDKHYKIALPDAFVCDAPARAFIKCIKGHTGYRACERCTPKGVYTDGKMTFPEMTAAPRTDSQVDEMVDEGHHNGVSPLKELGIGLVSHFVLDYMHLVCLGIVRKLIYLWIKGPLKCRVSATLLKIISKHMVSIRQN